MIRSQELLDKLIADLHFHNYMGVDVSDSFFSKDSEELNHLQSLINILGLEKELDVNNDFFHGGNVITKNKTQHIQNCTFQVFYSFKNFLQTLLFP